MPRHAGLIVPLVAALLLASPAGAQPPKLSITLDQAERAALAHSPILKQASSNLAAAQAQVEAQFAQLVPRATADGAFQYQTVVPKFSPAPGAPAVQFGAHDNWSIGPSVSYTLWDQGALRSAWRSQKALASSDEAQRELVARQVLLATRLDYFQVQLALEQERSEIDSLRIAEAQFRDIDSRLRAGAANRIDWLSARENVLGRRREVRSTQGDVAVQLRTLFAQTGQSQELDVSAPIDARVEGETPSGVSTPTVRVELEPLELVEARFEPAGLAPVDSAYPRLLVFERQSQAQRLAARSTAAGEWPRVQLSYLGRYEYPLLPALERTWQNTVGAAASVPLFEWGRTREQARAKRELADAAARQRDQAYDELLRDWHQARDRFAALRDQAAIDRDSVAETAEIARLRYASYRNGASTITDVETANLNAVEARVLAARHQTQLLIQLATLASLSSAKESP